MADGDRRQWADELAQTGAIVFPVDRRRLSLLVLGCLSFVATGVWMMATGSLFNKLVSVVGILFFGGLCLPIGLRTLITRQPEVRVDVGGVAWGRRRVAWSEITGIDVWHQGNKPMAVSLFLDRAAKHRLRSQGAPVVRWMNRLNERVGGEGAVRLPTTNGFEPEAMATWLEIERTARSSGSVVLAAAGLREITHSPSHLGTLDGHSTDASLTQALPMWRSRLARGIAVLTCVGGMVVVRLVLGPGPAAGCTAAAIRSAGAAGLLMGLAFAIAGTFIRPDRAMMSGMASGARLVVCICGIGLTVYSVYILVTGSHVGQGRNCASQSAFSTQLH